MKGMNMNKTPAPSKGGGSMMQKTSKPNGDNKMPSGKVDPHMAWKGDGGAKNGRVKGC